MLSAAGAGCCGKLCGSGWELRAGWAGSLLWPGSGMLRASSGSDSSLSRDVEGCCSCSAGRAADSAEAQQHLVGNDRKVLQVTLTRQQPDAFCRARARCAVLQHRNQPLDMLLDHISSFLAEDRNTMACFSVPACSCSRAVLSAQRWLMLVILCSVA